MGLKLTRSKKPGQRKTHNAVYWRKPTPASMALAIASYASGLAGAFCWRNSVVQNAFLVSMVFFILGWILGIVSARQEEKQMFLGNFDIPNSPTMRTAMNYSFAAGAAGLVQIGLFVGFILWTSAFPDRLIVISGLIVLTILSLLFRGLRDRLCGSLSNAAAF